ncbi:hypothetical protein I3843_09G108400 [Carya illinoinensis]|uniref:Uncharacterized protein n=1 Tax=Carya illinoinensis TaxID=32201 RepID=A0A922J6X3_CARIL|nr:hypothetical protein I3760_09G108100 [Carya illinoinensis]KAG6695648.1 hypothetical protein I3842_09G108400 [Carya illinoinensis]KAG7963233.1 hypothetical protein I3843_09G108400 [Carya illinoinensis]
MPLKSTAMAQLQRVLKNKTFSSSKDLSWSSKVLSLRSCHKHHIMHRRIIFQIALICCLLLKFGPLAKAASTIFGITHAISSRTNTSFQRILAVSQCRKR